MLNRTHPEVDALLACVSASHTADHRPVFKAILQQPLDWDCLLQLAYYHRLAPLLYWNVSREPEIIVPSPQLAELRHTFHTIVARNLLLTQELLRVLSLFTAEGVRVLPIKGPTLALAAYDNVALRPFSDLDLLVHPASVNRAARLLTANGYWQMLHLTAAQEAVFRHAAYHHQFSHRDSGHLIELHWGISPRYFSANIVFDALWERRDQLQLGGTAVPGLAAEDLLMVLATHGAKSFWLRLEWIAAVAGVVARSPGLDWAWLQQDARHIGLARALDLCLLLAEDLGGAPLPPHVTARARRDPTTMALMGQVTARLLRDAPNEFDDPNSASFLVFHVRVRERLADRLRYCVERVLTPTIEDFAAQSLPDQLTSLYWVLRPLRLGMKYVRAQRGQDG